MKNVPTAIDGFLLGWQFLLFLSLGLPAFAQVSTANLMGIVQDSTNASIPDASIKLINIMTGTENDSKTNGEGRFILPGVIPGSYTLQIEREGFATTQVNGIDLNLGDTKNLLIRMKVGSVTESVNVDASGITLNTTDGSVSTVVDQRFVRDIPLNGRSFQDLISMTPGIVTPSPQTAGRGFNTQGDFSVNGQRLESNSFFVDGVSANIGSGLISNNARIATTGSSAGSTALGTTQSLVSIDALQEFRVLSSTYSAEYGRTPGGQFTFLTRSGTDVFHGSLYTHWRDYVVDGSDWFTSSLFPNIQTRPPTFSQNDFGGTLGGPIFLPGILHGDKKTFIFASYEGLLLDQPNPPAFNYVPSFAVLSEVPGPIQGVLGFGFGQANIPIGGTITEINDASGKPSGLSPTVAGNYSLPARVNSTSVRLDQTVSPRFSFFLRYGSTPSYSESNELSSLTANHVHTQTLTLGAIAQVSATKSNDLRLGLARSNSSSYTQAGTETSFYIWNRFGLTSSLGMPSLSPSVRADVFIHIPGVGDTEAYANNASSFLHQWNLRDTFSLQVANHLFRFGIDQRHVTSTVYPAALSVEADFFTHQSMTGNLASHIVISKNLPASPVLNEFSAFAQDEWRATKALTVSLGLRWELNPPPDGRHGIDPYTAVGSIDSPATLRVAPRGTPLWHTGWLNLAPRFGAAWKIDDKPGRELIAHAGAGVFFDTGNQQALGAFNALGFTATSYLSDVPVPLTPLQLDFPDASSGTYRNSLVYNFPSDLQLPYSIQWNVGIEKALGRNQALTISWVGAHGARLLQEQRRDVQASNPNFGEVAFFPSGVTSSYQSLQLRFQRSISRGVQALAAYTWAHSLDYGSTDPLYPLVRGNSDLDVRHNLEAALTWNAPKPGGNYLRRMLLGGWGVDGRLIARTAYPVTLFGNLFSDPVTGARYYNSVDRIPNRPLYLYGSQYTGGRVINGGPNVSNPAFGLPVGTSEGDAPRNFVRGLDAVQLNAAVEREAHVFDRLNVQLRAEAFNVLNHPDFGYIDPSLSDALFGQTNRMLNQSFGPAGSLYQQGGPRSVQISFKILF